MSLCVSYNYQTDYDDLFDKIIFVLSQIEQLRDKNFDKFLNCSLKEDMILRQRYKCD